MLTLKQLLAFIFVTGFSTAAFANAVDTSQWVVRQDAADGYSFRYPDSTIPGSVPEGIKTSITKGRSCINGNCSDDVGINWYDPSGKGRITILNFQIQRNLNPSSLPIDKLYVALGGKLGPEETVMTIGGKPAIRAATGSYFIELNATDILSLPCHKGETALDKVCQAMALSLTFP